MQEALLWRATPTDKYETRLKILDKDFDFGISPKICNDFF